MDYLYGKLDELIESQKYKLSTQHPLQGSIDSTNTIKLSVDLERLVTIKQVKKDNVPDDDIIKYYRLYLFNDRTGLFDIPVGDEIVVNSQVGSFTQISSVIIGGQEVPAVITETGQLKLDYIPVSALMDKEYIIDPETNDIVYYENIIDGND